MIKKKYLLAFTFFASLLVVAYIHLTKNLETYGIMVQFARPISSPVPEGLQSIKASECGQCHVEIYKEWQTTIHAKAWKEDYFQTDWRYDKSKQNCLNCHTPFENQQENLVVGFKNDNLWKPIFKTNPNFDAAFRDEGVTCASCHIVKGKIRGPHKSEDAPHATSYAPEMRNGSSVCVRCHVTDATHEASIGNPNLCSTMSEIEANKIKPNCIECHMPKITRPLMEGYPARLGRQHLWRGGHDPKMVSKDLRLEIKQRSNEGSNYAYDIVLTNIGTHHKLPTGVPDRHIIVTMELLNGKGEVVKSKTHKIIRRIFWRPVIFEWSDNRLEFEKPQTVGFEFSHAKGDGPLTLRVKAVYHFLESWRRKQLKLAADSHLPYLMQQKSISVGLNR
ncbi:MAG: hypothetical protein GY927_05840 [bacterium]|nr:hypothetical protein [bacterium]